MILLAGHDVVTSYGELNYESLYQDNLVGECIILKNKSVIETVPSTYEHFKHLKVKLREKIDWRDCN